MAALSASDRAKVAREFMRDAKDAFSGVLQDDIHAAVAGVDDYLETNTTALNQAIPQPARANLTAGQKGLLYRMVIAARHPLNGG